MLRVRAPVYCCNNCSSGPACCLSAPFGRRVRLDELGSLMSEYAWPLAICGAVFLAAYTPIFFIARANGRTRHFFLMLSQMLIIAFMGGWFVYVSPGNNAAFLIGGVIGMAVAYVVTVIPIKLLDWFRARRALRARVHLSQEADHGYESAWSGWSGSEDSAELLDVALSEEPGELRRIPPKTKPGIPVLDEGKRFLR